MLEAASPNRLFIGCAGWTLPRHLQSSFPPEGSHLERYAARFSAVEINSSFYRPHRTATYARWAASVPEGFRFSVKVPKRITHELRLRDATEALLSFWQEVEGLGDRLGCLLVQLPPSLQFEEHIAGSFFDELRRLHAGNVACEPRHATWFATGAERLLCQYDLARVAADPALHPGADLSAGNPRLRYIRLHGSPQTYYSAYSDQFLANLAVQLNAMREGAETWCIFDNTAAGHAISNALQTQQLVVGMPR